MEVDTKTILKISSDLGEIKADIKNIPDQIKTAILEHNARCKETKELETVKKVKMWKPIIKDFLKMATTAIVTVLGFKAANQ